MSPGLPDIYDEISLDSNLNASSRRHQTAAVESHVGQVWVIEPNLPPLCLSNRCSSRGKGAVEPSASAVTVNANEKTAGKPRWSSMKMSGGYQSSPYRRCYPTSVAMVPVISMLLKFAHQVYPAFTPSDGAAKHLLTIPESKRAR